METIFGCFLPQRHKEGLNHPFLHMKNVRATPHMGTPTPAFPLPLGQQTLRQGAIRGRGTRLYTALCRLTKRWDRINEKKSLISQLLTEFGLFIGINSVDKNYKENHAVVASKGPVLRCMCIWLLRKNRIITVQGTKCKESRSAGVFGLPLIVFHLETFFLILSGDSVVDYLEKFYIFLKL